MRLTDLSPKWVAILGWASKDPFYIGVTFLCPHCKAIRLYAPFKNPVDPAGWIGRGILFASPADGWARTGDAFETLTLVPSFNAGRAGHWHGFIQNGDVT